MNLRSDRDIAATPLSSRFTQGGTILPDRRRGRNPWDSGAGFLPTIPAACACHARRQGVRRALDQGMAGTDAFSPGGTGSGRTDRDAAVAR